MNPTDTPSRRYAWSGALCLVGGALAVLVQWLLTPVDASLEASELLAQVADHHTAMGWALALDVPILLVIPAVLFAGHLAGSRTSVLAGIATAICFVPMLGSVVLLAFDALVYEAATQPDRGAAARLVDDFQNNAFVGGLTVFYLLTHVIGFILLAVALYRARAVPVWACVAVAVWPLLELGGYAAGTKVVVAVGYGALLLGYAACAAVLLREGRTATPDVRARDTAQATS